jgi:hypothetical protein
MRLRIVTSCNMLDVLKHYVHTRLALAGLQAQVAATAVLAVLVRLLLQGLLLLLALFLLGISLGLSMGLWVKSMPLGFLLAGLLYGICALICYFCRRPLTLALHRHIDHLITDTLSRTHEPHSPPLPADDRPERGV